MNWKGRTAVSGEGQERAQRSRVHKQSRLQSQGRRWREGMGGKWVGWIREGGDGGRWGLDAVWVVGDRREGGPRRAERSGTRLSFREEEGGMDKGRSEKKKRRVGRKRVRVGRESSSGRGGRWIRYGVELGRRVGSRKGKWI